MSNQSDKNWWEFYGIRYAQGTVVGALIVFFLFSQTEALKGLLFIPKDPKDFGMSHLFLLGIYGLAYCYIASAPILIMHAGRGLMFKSPINPNPNSEAHWRPATLILLPAIFSVIFYLYWSKDKVDIMGFYLYSFLVTFEYVTIIQIFTTSWSKTIGYYHVIISKRSISKNAEYVESYKHIREHGNSFFIVFFEIMLALPIYQFVSKVGASHTNSISNLTLIIFFWVMPAALIWIFGNKLENNLNFMQ